jgi:hypothetical protein
MKPVWEQQSLYEHLLLLEYSIALPVYIYCGLHAFSEIFLFLFYILQFGQQPLSAPVFDYAFSPLGNATSIIDFWNSGWHQLLRNTFIQLVMNPVRRFTATTQNDYRGNTAIAVFCVFECSGLLHQWLWYVCTHHYGQEQQKYSSTQAIFFVLQGIMCVGQHYMRKQYPSLLQRIPTWLSRILTLIVLFESATIIFSVFAITNSQADLPLDNEHFFQRLSEAFLPFLY